MKASRPLDSDQLGQKGEHRFSEFCTDAHLKPNKSEYDRTGWDYVVDWPHGPTTRPLDSRPAPPTCLVQLKTVWSETKSVRFRLSSLERLAKELRPAFVVVLKVNGALEVKEAWGAHLRDDFLSHVLRNLREAQLADKQPNNVDITVSIKKWFTPMPPTGAAFREWAEGAIGASMADYGAAKQRQLSTLGYERGFLDIKTTLEADTSEDMIEGLLGLRPIRATHFEGIDQRFDLPLPSPDVPSGSGMVEFKPFPFDSGVLLARGAAEDVPARFKVDLYRTPALRGDRSRVLIRSQVFRMMLRLDEHVEGSGTVGMNFTLESGVVEGLKQPCLSWRDLARLMGWLTGGNIVIEVMTKKKPRNLRWDGTTPAGLKGRDHWRRVERLAEAGHAILERAGWQGTKVNLHDLHDVAEDIFVVEAMLRDPSRLDPLTFATEKAPSERGDAPEQMLYFNYFPLGKHRVAYAAVIDLSMQPADELCRWSGTINRVFSIQRLQDRERNYESFIEECRASAGLRSYVAITGVTTHPSATLD